MRILTWLRDEVGGDRRPSSARRRTKSGPGRRPRLRFERLEDRTVPAGGVLDPTFGTGGVVNSLVATGGEAFAVATYPQAGTANDGKIVVAGLDHLRNADTEFAVVRYNLDGSLDKTFGGSGGVFGPKGRARAVAIQPDGKIVAAGTSISSSGGAFELVRFNVGGSLDGTFGSRGVATTTITAKGFDEIWAVSLQADGKIVVAGGTSPANGSTRELAVVRYNANGSLDTSFGTGGEARNHIALSPLAGGGTSRIGLVIDAATGNIVVDAAGPTNFALVVRYTGAGALDTSFSGVGYETLSNLYSYGAVAIPPSGPRIVVAGRSAVTGTESLVGLNQDGTPDSSFGAGGTVVTNIFAPLGPTQSAMLQADGRIVVGATSGGPAVLTVMRFNSGDGSLDTSFGVNGVARLPAGTTSSSSLGGMALEPDGRIVVAGTTSTGYVQFVVARFLAAGPRIDSFGASPNPVAAGGNTTLTANVTALNPGSTVTQVAFYSDSNGDGVLDAGDDRLGFATLSNGVWALNFTVPTTWTSGGHRLFAQAQDGFGVLGDPLALDLEIL
jgi:uncharacterized delta-60 repeat protein